MKPNDTYDDEDAAREVAAAVQEVLQTMSAPEVFEAGGGSLCHVVLPHDARITAIDISPEQLDRNDYAQTKILGDLHTHELPPDSFDVIVCWNVVEHLERPDKVVDSFVKWVRPGGLIIIAAPNPSSLSGLITKYTPHGFHVFVLKRIFRSPTAGLPGHAPFPTFMHPAMTPAALERSLREQGLKILHLRRYASIRERILKERRPWISAAYQATLATLRVLSLGRWHPEYSDYHLVAQKPQVAARVKAAPPPVPVSESSHDSLRSPLPT